jgi:hypothetical protein
VVVNRERRRLRMVKRRMGVKANVWERWIVGGPGGE